MVLVLAATGAAAQVHVDKTRPATPDGLVQIENSFGSVRVIGWDRSEVSVTGRLAPGAEHMDLSGDKDSVWIDVDIPESWLYDSDDDTEYQTHLEIQVPAGSSVEVETLNASISVDNVNGEMELESVNGSIVIRGNPQTVEVDTITGGVEVNAQSAEMEVSTVSGKVVLAGVARAVAVETVSGLVEIAGDGLEEVEIETTSGDIQFDGTFTVEGSFNVETFSGHVDLLVAHDVAAKFSFVTFKGLIENEMGPRPRHQGRFNPYQEVRFSTGLNDYEVSVSTYSGNSKLRARGGPDAP
jgi:hypothetical protein